MGKKRYLNPSLNEDEKTPFRPRKIRVDKQHDIKLPITEKMDYILRLESRKHFEGSKTSIATNIFLHGLYRIIDYPETPYKDGPITVHVKVRQEDYEKLAIYAAEWRCSMRKAAHRIFCEAARRHFGGIMINEEL